MGFPSLAGMLYKPGMNRAMLRWGIGGALIVPTLAVLVRAAALRTIAADPMFWALSAVVGCLTGLTLCIANRQDMERLQAQIDQDNARLEALRQRATTDRAAAGEYVQELQRLVEEIRRLARPRRLLFRKVSFDLTAGIPLLEEQISAFEKIRDQRAI